MSESEGKQVLCDLGHGIGKLRSETIWHTHDLSNESMVNMVEIKAMLIYAERKINKIYKREGFNNAELK